MNRYVEDHLFKPKNKLMKTIIVLALAATAFTACNDQKKTETTTTVNSDTMTTAVDTTTNAINNTTTVTTYTPAEGDVAYRDGKLMVYRNNAYVEADKDVTLDDGIVVRRNGEVTRNGVVVKMEDGETVSKTGRFFNKTGAAIDDAWDATKRGVSKAAKAVGKGAKKVGEEVKDAVH
jgi:hypothetical protein